MTRALPAAVLTCVILGLACLAQQDAPDLPPPAPVPATGPAASAPARRPPPAATPLRPYTAFSWHPTEKLPHIRPMLWFDQGIPLGELAKRTAGLEPGTRVVLNLVYGAHIIDHPLDVIRDAEGRTTHGRGLWPDHSTAAVRARWAPKIDWFADAGGQIDFMALDQETDHGNWSIDEKLLQALAGDPRWPAMAKELGYDDPLLTLWQNSRHGEYLKWNAVMERRKNVALDEALFGPLRRRFPKAGMSNFGGFNQTPENVVPDANGHNQYSLGDPCGTHQSPVFYGKAAPYGIHKIVIDFERPYPQVLYAANVARGCARSTSMPMLPWVGWRSWRYELNRATSWGGTDYWQEGMYHIMLSGGTDNLIYFNPAGFVAEGGGKKVIGLEAGDHPAMEAVMADIERAAGGHRIVAPAVTAATPWDAKTVMSAAKLADGSTLFRVTFDEGETAAGIKVGDKVMRVDRPAGKVGAWVRVFK